MCGIAGWLSSSTNLYEKTTLLEKMSETLKERGPDEKGFFIKQDVSLIHRRLAVVDIEHGKQPMSADFMGETYVLVYNGELYNSEEIRQELRIAGYGFEGHSDTEVVLKAYIHWKEKCAEKFNGIFAFGIYEVNKKRLYLCRDRIGVKPLFFTHKGGDLVFGSLIKTLLESKVAQPVINSEGLCEIFFLGPARTPGQGVFRDIEELLPGEYAIFEGNKLTRYRYFTIEAKEFDENEEEALEHTRYLIQDSIRRQLVSDVPLCCFLSGGLDSSIITHTASQYYKANSKGKLNTYSVEYKDNAKYFTKSLFQPNSDTEYIKLMIESADTEHHQVVLDNTVLADALYEATCARNLPGMADVDSSLLLFCKEVKKDFTVALSGECADELFGGYPWYHNKEILFEECFPWSRSQDIRRSILKKGILPFGEEYVMEKYRDTIRKVTKLPTDSPLTSRMREMFYLNFYWFMQCLLDRKDRCSMACGLEVRVPFCDWRIVEYAYNMPWELKSLYGREKGIIRKAFEGILPYDICYRKKSPYPKTHNPVYFEHVAKKVKRILDKKNMLTEMLDKDGIYSIIENPESISSPWYGQLMRAPQILAYIIQLDTWFDMFNVIIE